MELMRPDQPSTQKEGMAFYQHLSCLGEFNLGEVREELIIWLSSGTKPYPGKLAQACIIL